MIQGIVKRKFQNFQIISSMKKNSDIILIVEFHNNAFGLYMWKHEYWLSVLEKYCQLHKTVKKVVGGPCCFVFFWMILFWKVLSRFCCDGPKHLKFPRGLNDLGETKRELHPEKREILDEMLTIHMQMTVYSRFITRMKIRENLKVVPMMIFIRNSSLFLNQF